MKKLIQKIFSPFTAHPRSVGESYFQHLWVATSFAARLIGGAFALIIHAVLPFLFTYTGSNVITQLYNTMTARKKTGSKSVEHTERPNHTTL